MQIFHAAGCSYQYGTKYKFAAFFLVFKFFGFKRLINNHYYSEIRRQLIFVEICEHRPLMRNLRNTHSIPDSLNSLIFYTLNIFLNFLMIFNIFFQKYFACIIFFCKFVCVHNKLKTDNYLFVIHYYTDYK